MPENIRSVLCAVLLALATWLPGIPVTLADAAPVVPGAYLQQYADYSRTFDPARDPVRDLEQALQAARSEGRRVLVMVGGDWCVWCFLLDRYLRTDVDATRILYGEFEVLRVYYGDDNTNDAFLDRFPEFEMFPHFFVVESDGRVLASIPADVLIADAKYDVGRIRAFAARWGRH